MLHSLKKTAYAAPVPKTRIWVGVEGSTSRSTITDPERAGICSPTLGPVRPGRPQDTPPCRPFHTRRPGDVLYVWQGETATPSP